MVKLLYLTGGLICRSISRCSHEGGGDGVKALLIKVDEKLVVYCQIKCKSINWTKNWIHVLQNSDKEFVSGGGLI